MIKDAHLKPIYKVPMVFKLDGPESSFGQIACAPGSNPSPGTDCVRNGNQAGPGNAICQNGNQNTGILCNNGGSHVPA